MTKIKILSISVAVLILLNIGLLIMMFLQGPPHHPKDFPPHHDQEGPKELIIHQLHFSDEQKEAYQKLIEVHQQKIRGLDKNIRETKNRLYAELNTATSVIKDSLMQAISTYQLEIENTHYNHFLDIKKLCKPDQLKYFEELTKELAFYFRPNKNKPPVH
jgi:periplasmic protein CpxP/Spy